MSLLKGRLYFTNLYPILFSSAILNYSSIPFNFAILIKRQNIKTPNPNSLSHFSPTPWQGKSVVGH